MNLNNKLKSVEMTISNTLTNYLMQVTQIGDHFAAIREKIEDKELVNKALKGFPP